MSGFKYEPSVADLIEAYAMSGDGLDFKRAANERREAAREALAAHDAEVRASVSSVGSGEPYQHIAEEPEGATDV